MASTRVKLSGKANCTPVVSLQRIKDFHVISVVCKSRVNGKLLFVRQNIQYFVSNRDVERRI